MSTVHDGYYISTHGITTKVSVSKKHVADLLGYTSYHCVKLDYLDNYGYNMYAYWGVDNSESAFAGERNDIAYKLIKSKLE